MSRQNKVNPGMYTQRGRLTQDDAARELARMREPGSPGTWSTAKPVKKKAAKTAGKAKNAGTRS